MKAKRRDVIATMALCSMFMMNVSCSVLNFSRSAETPYKFSVEQNTPEPFNRTTTITYTVPVQGQVTVEVFHLTGNKLVTLVDKEQKAGTYSVVWDASQQQSGVYFYSVKTGDKSMTRKMTYVR